MVALTDQDKTASLNQAGFTLRRLADGSLVMPQPCQQLDNLKCQSYEQRPCRCRLFECLTLKAFRAGDLDRDEALKTIQIARHLVNELKMHISRHFSSLSSFPVANFGRELKAYSRRLPLNDRRRLQAHEKVAKKAYLKLREMLDAHFYSHESNRSNR